MQIFEIIDKNNKRYKLKQKNKIKSIELIFEFFGIDNPQIGWEILINKKLLDKKYEGFSQPYSFELYLEYNDEKLVPINDEEFIVLHNEDKNYVMKRIYG